MKTHFSDPLNLSWELPKEFQEEDVRLSETVITKYIERYTKRGEMVFDPFAGYGTSLRVSSRLNRKAFGIEIVPERVVYAQSVLSEDAEMVSGDIRTIQMKSIPEFNLSISSPPYMNQGDKKDPLSGYVDSGKGYDTYVSELSDIYVSLKEKLSDKGRIVIQLQNLRNSSHLTPLAWDLHRAIGDRLCFEGEEITTWDELSYGYDHGYCLIYSRY